MATLFITEYAKLSNDGLVTVPCGEEPAITSQAVSFSGTAGVSAAFTSATNFVRVHCDADACILFGTAPTALTTSPRIAAGVSEYFGVPRGSSLKVSAIVSA